MSAERRGRRAQLEWVEGLKAFGILGILWNHLVEEFGAGPWFTNPTGRWQPLAERLHTFYPSDDQPLVALLRFVGWLGDAGPGVFIFASGLGLTMAALSAGGAPGSIRAFFVRRAERLYPLYVAMHVVILGAALLVPGAGLSMASTGTLQSLLGLRFTDDTFFSISPSWWFVWLILQFYLVFPALLWGLRRFGPARFLLVTVILTVISRAVGILTADQLYYWMTGKFFGSRLAEFALGMVVGHALQSGKVPADRPMAPALAGLIGACAYVAGMAASIFLPTTVISNFLVTVGWVGLCYACFTILARSDRARAAVVWVGGASFAVFLLHQPPLMWTRVLFPGYTSAHLTAAALVLVLSFPIGRLIERVVQRATERGRGVRDALTLWVSVTLAVLLLVVHPLVLERGRQGVFAWVTGVAIIALVLAEWRRLPQEPSWQRLVRWTVAGAGVAQLWFDPIGVPYLGVIVGGLTGVTAGWLAVRGLRPVLALSAGGVVGLAGVILMELVVRRIAPAEAGGWGELPALSEHPRWTYALKPNATTRLRYNQYDYIVRSNGLGLPGPERASGPPPAGTLRLLVAGDAFTMPEGLPYEQGYPALLERSLGRCMTPAPVEVVNAGITGYGPMETTAQLEELIPLLRPRVVVYEFFVNEFSEVNQTREQRLASIGLIAPRSRRARVLSRLHLAVRLRELGARIAGALTGTPVPGPYWSSVVRFYQRRDGPWYADSTLAKLAGRLGTMRDVAKREGAWFGILFVPAALAVRPISEVSYAPAGVQPAQDPSYDLDRPWRSLSAMADSLGVPLLDTSPALRQSPPGVYHPGAWHWTPAGHKVAGDTLLAWLAREHQIPAGCGQNGVRGSAP